MCTLFHGWRKIATIVMLGAVCFVGWVASLSLKTEKRLIAVASTAHLVEEYLRKNHGRWPASWEDLDGMESDGGSAYSCCDSRSTLRQFVSIDFGATLPDVANAVPSNSPFIRPIGPCSRSYELQVARLIETAKSLDNRQD